MTTYEWDTPALTIDLDRLQSNIERVQTYLDQHQIHNRPHIKTHKIPEIAHMQLRAGAAGITCQKLGEVEIMAQAGIRDIFLPYNIMGQPKLERLRQLAKRVDLSLTADSLYTALGYSRIAMEAGVVLNILVEFDTGKGRCGVQTPEQAAELAQAIDSLDGLRFAGLMTYPCNEMTDDFVEQTKSLLAQQGLAIERISAGGTPQLWQAHEHQTVTEYRAGTYVYGDRRSVQVGMMTYEQCALHIQTTVVSRPTETRGILDAGSKALSSDTLSTGGYGYLVQYPDAVIYALSEEHGFVDFSACATQPAIGEQVSVVPNHCCVANNLFNEAIGVRDGLIEAQWSILARGLMQ